MLSPTNHVRQASLFLSVSECWTVVAFLFYSQYSNVTVSFYTVDSGAI